MADDAQEPIDNTASADPQYLRSDGYWQRPSIDPQFIAERAQDMRMACIRAALDLNGGRDSSPGNLIAAADELLTFVMGDAK